MSEPFTVYFKPTNRCNMKCQHCYHAMMGYSADMTDDVFERSIAWINGLKKQNRFIFAQLHGGEPMLYDIKKLHTMVDSTVSDNLSWGVTTNLVYDLTQDKIDLFYKCKPYGTPFIQTSWDYLIRFRSSQEETWETNVKCLLSKGINVQPTFCVTKQLINDLSPKAVLDRFLNLGVDHVGIERITNTGRAKEGLLTPKNSLMDKWLFECYLYYKELDGKLSIPLFEGIEQSIRGNYIGCRSRRCTKTVFTINVDGSIGSCPNTANYAPNNVKTIKIVPSKLSKAEETNHTSCFMCEYFNFCRGDCFQLAFDETGCPGLKSIYAHLLKK